MLVSRPPGLARELIGGRAPIRSLIVGILDAAPEAAPVKVTVIGAGNVGATTAMRIAESDVCREVVLVDIAPGLAEGLALDLGQSAPIEGFRTRITGTDGLRR